MDSKIGEWDQYSLINELTQGREAAKLLKIQLNAASSSFSHDQAREILDQKIISSYDNALSILNFSISLSSSQDPQMTELMIEYPPSLRGSPWSDQDSDRDVKDPQELEDGTRKRKKFPRWTEKVRVSPGAGLMGPLDDGFSWRKYGQKDILGAKYPRGYYRCAHRHGKGCLATKQVQRSDEDPTIFEITYRGIHTCAQASQSIIFPPPPQPETQEPTTTIRCLNRQTSFMASSSSYDQISSYEKALSMLNFSSSLSSSQDPQMTELMIEYPPSLTGSPWSDQGSDYDVKDPQELEDGSRKRKTFPRWTEKVRVSPGAGLMGPLDDGFSWRKYGQKDILGAKYPRGYYRCAHRHGKGCLATKQVQRSDEDPTIFEITYRGIHTCAQAPQSIIFPPPPQPETQEPTTTIRCLNRQTSFMASSSSYDQISSYEKALSMHNFSSSLSSSQDPQMTELMIEYPPSLRGSPWSDQDSDRDVKDPQELEDGSRKRKKFPRWTEKVRVSPGAGLMGPLDDGFSWRKYGQKDILGAKYPRGYYRCTHRHGKGCLATKQVQRSDEDPTIFEITYRGIHTCAQASQSIIFPPPPQPGTQEPTTTIRCLNRQTSFMASSSSYDQIYDVFISFRREYPLDNFTCHLYAALSRNRISTFIDDELLSRGNDISVALLNTIENSKISIIIFTNNYASSKWCLDELVKIHECHKMNGQIILPVFYHVDPFDVKKQTGSFGDSFIMLENRFKEMPEMVKNWRDVLTEASNLFGWASNEFRCEAQFIDVIVSDILNKLEKITVSTNSNDLVGLRNEQDKKAFKFKSIDLYHSRFLNGMLDLSSTLSCLSRLNLSDCALMAIPRDIGILSSLKELYLGGNNFVSLPTSMKQLSRLEHLELNNCKMLRSLPELPLFLHYLEACNCDCLQYLPEIPPYLEKLDISTHERLSNVAKYSLEKRSYEASPSWKMDCIVNSRMKLNEKANKILADSQLRFQQMAIASLRQPMYGNVSSSTNSCDLVGLNSRIEQDKKLEHILVSKEDKLVSLFDEACDRLDSHASTFWNHKDLKQLHLKLAQVYDLLRHSKYCTSNQNVILTLWLSNLKGLPCDIDNLLDDWEQLEISRLKFNEEVRRTHEWLVQFWNSFDRCVTGQKEDMSAISELNSARSDEYTVFERDLERSIDSVKHVLLLDVNMVQIITILGMSGTGKTVFAQRIYSNEEVKSHFPLRFWFKVGMNLSFLTVVKAIKVRWCEIRGAEKMLSKRLLIVLDNVCDLDEEKLDKFRLLISDMCDSGSCVLVTTHSDHVATAMRTVPALHFSYFTETDSLSDFNCELLPALQAHGHRLGYEKDLRIEAPELAVMADPQRYLESDTDEGPELSPEDDMSHPPSTGMLAVHESKIQLAPSETVELAVQVPRTIATPERNVQKIFRYVNDVTALKIGVHGVGGIGKTAALKNLICYPGIKSLFDMVILVTVSRYWNTRKIQNEVLRQLSLHREDYETDSEVSGRLLQVLNGKKFLLLLDDVWEQIDLEAMGIPVPSAENGCKILTASRKLDVCHNMNASKVIELESLSWKEAWQLFYEQVGGIVQSPAIRPFARAVVKGCHGLPLLIIVTGKALVEENNDSMWEHASKTFSPPCTATVYQTEDVVQLLKFSFDQLKDGDVKSCFLYYALFSDQEVTISGLIEDCIQEGIISGTHADAHKRGCDIIDVLVKAYLVQVTKDNDTIKMHGLIRDLALGIISSAAEDDAQFLLRAYSRLVEPPRTRSSSSSSSLESPESGRLFIPEAHQFLLGAHAGLTEPPSEEEWICAKMIFLMDNELYTLPNRLSCPNLLMLFLQRNCRLRVIPPSFFELMTSLKVLNLSKTRIKSLPKTLVYLKCLEVLILRDCELLLELPSEVGSLNCLEVLDLEGTEINKLPDEVGKLASLRYLNAFFYGSIDKSANITLPCNLISSGTLSGLQALETLSIVVYPGDKRWNKDVKDVITEVSKLTKLSSLRFYFPKIEYVAEFLKGSVAWKDQHLTEFKFVVGHDVKSIVSRVADYVQFDYNQQDRCLRFVNGKSISTEVLQILARSTAFYVDHHLGIDSLSNFGVCNMNGLKFCVVSECPKIKTVVDIKEHTTTAVFPGLENLTVNYLWNLTRLWEGIVPEGSFVELRSLSVLACQQLKYVFTSSMIQSLSKLEELTVEHCPAVKSIILDGEIIDSGCIMLPGLKKLRLHYLPELVNVWSNDWPSLEYISFYGCPKLKKIGMDSKLKDTLIWIKAEKKWWAELDWKDAELPIHLEDRLSIFSEDSEDQEPSFCS